MLATACSNDEVVKVADNGAAISFSSFVNNSTRATDNTYANLANLQVWGVTSRGNEIAATEIFNGEIATKGSAEAGTGIWTYSPLRYWIAGNAYSFAAIAPANATGVKVDQDLTGEWSEAGLKVTFDNEAAKAGVDILYATAGVDEASANNAAVGLNLKHMLSRVRFQFENAFPGDETIVIKNLKINNATAKADITKAEATGTWSNPTGSFVVPFEIPENDTNKAGKMVTSDHMYLIPLTEATEYNISFTVELYNGTDLLATYEHKGKVVEGTENSENPQYAGISLGAQSFKNNCSYTFTAKIDPTTIDPENELKPIQFTATVDDWQPWENGTTKPVTLK